MLKALQFVKRKQEPRPPQTEEEKTLLIQEAIELERALIAMDTILDGQIEQATSMISQDDKVFTKVATGVLRFIESTVSLEPENIYRAIDALHVSEQAAAKMKHTAENSSLQISSYRPGAEFELAELESGMMAAISMLLTESKIEILKALYKIRKTYLALEELRKHVLSVNQLKETDDKKRNETESDSVHHANGNFCGETLTSPEFDTLHRKRTQRSQAGKGSGSPRETVDEYLQSGVETLSGLIHLILSSVPPTIARLLSVVGLHGERNTALDLLWHSSETFLNIHGSIALIALIMFFDGQLQYQDIVLDRSEEDKISLRAESDAQLDTKGKTTALLTPNELRNIREHLLKALRQQRVYYPRGVLWLLQEGRLVTHDNLLKGVAILESPECGPNQMLQVEGLLIFDRTMFLLLLDRLEDASTAFIELMKFSSWSHPLYLYLAAACHLEMYRSSADKNSESALKNKRQATELFKKAPTATGKKKVLGRKMPFDGYVVRKVALFQQNAKQRNLDLVDAIGVSPLYEALYFWNAPSRMSPDMINTVVERIKYSSTGYFTESPAEKFTRKLLEGSYSRRSQNSDEGYALLKDLTDLVVSGDIEGKSSKKVVYHRQGEPWSGPACLYERAIYEWVKFGPKNAKQVRRWLDLCADWTDDYELSTRIGMKITAARDRLDIYRL